MAFPEYIPVRPVSIGGARVLESSDLLKVRVTINASKSLVWDATGYRFEKLKVVSTSELGSEIVISLPRTDVQGWRDPAVNAVIDVTEPGSFTHRYTATVEFLDAADRPIGVRPVTLGPFTVPDGEGVIDLDKTVPVSSVSGELVMIPDLWGQLVVQAEAAAVEAKGAVLDSATFVAEQIGDPESPAGVVLSNTYGSRLRSLANQIGTKLRAWPGRLTADVPTVTVGTAATVTGRQMPFQSAAREVVSRGAWDPTFNRWKVQGTGPFTGFDAILEGDTLELEVVMVGTSFTYMVLVDDEPVDGVFTATATSSGFQYFKLAFGSVKHRRVTVYFGGVGAFRFLTVPMTQSIEPAPAKPVLCVVGDSFLAGSAGSSSTDGFMFYVCLQLGIEYTGTVFGGTGYASAGSFTKFGDPARVAAAAKTKPDVLVFVGSVNDDDKANVQAEAAATFAAYAAALPGVPMIVFGPQPSAAATTIGAARAQRIAAVKAAADASPSVVAFFDMVGTGAGVPAAWSAGNWAGGSVVTHLGSVWLADWDADDTRPDTPGSGGWKRVTYGFDGTGRVGGATGNGNRDVNLYSDQVHPTAAGQRAFWAASLRVLTTFFARLVAEDTRQRTLY